MRSELLRILGTDKVAHAYLFVGPRGSGKTSSARILARVVNCHESVKSGKYQEPCGKCDACLTIKNQSAVDVIEIDAASHRGIDDIRDLREKIKLAPVSLQKKIYIIDEVHMLTNEAFNALLKTLEEPPGHAMFILCTTEDHKVPETISSRCVRIGFRKGNTQELLESLKRAVSGEKLEIDEKALKVLADAVDGSFREGHKVLEQLAQIGGKISEDRVNEVLGLVSQVEVEKLIDRARNGDTVGVVEVMKSMDERGVDAIALLKDILESLKKKIRVDIGSGKQPGAFERRLARELAEISFLIKSSPVPLLPIEVCLIELAGGEKTEFVKPATAVPPKTLAQNFPIKEKASPPIKKACPAAKVSSMPEKAAEESDESGNAEEYCGQIGAELDEVNGKWDEYLTRVSQRVHSVAGLLRSARPKRVEGNRLTIEVFYKFHQEQLEQSNRRLMLEEEASKLWGLGVVNCVLGEKAPDSVVEAAGIENISSQRVESSVLKAAEEIFS